MNFEILWTKNAYSDLSSITLFILKNFGNKSAEDFILSVDSTIQIIASFPQIGRSVNSEKQIRGLLITPQTKLIYRIRNRRIIILNLFDTRQNPENLKVNEQLMEYKS